ncbi:hypothetical protein [Salsuginibacillus kocurii]|uniref:hypothetical protein n=1 Tax=Salsuginibacillus kocurii TaxID=427078 RepID=UPI00037C943D|nr:hypothetical protein [Salsuginibacillus kocurii]
MGFIIFIACSCAYLLLANKRQQALAGAELGAPLVTATSLAGGYGVSSGPTSHSTLHDSLDDLHAADHDPHAGMPQPGDDMIIDEQVYGIDHNLGIVNPDPHQDQGMNGMDHMGNP